MLPNENKQKESFIRIILRFLCLLLPIAAAFAGYFLAPSIFNIFTQKKTTELFKFLCSIVFFAIPTIVIFFTVRKLRF